jgi:hypothetical protein
VPSTGNSGPATICHGLDCQTVLFVTQTGAQQHHCCHQACTCACNHGSSCLLLSAASASVGAKANICHARHACMPAWHGSMMMLVPLALDHTGCAVAAERVSWA